jgi:hypothetical protein
MKQKIDNGIRMLMKYWDSENINYPQWFNENMSYIELPRYASKEHIKYRNLLIAKADINDMFKIEIKSPTSVISIGEIQSWVIDCLIDKWVAYYGSVWYFQNKKDAVAFKLRWGC